MNSCLIHFIKRSVPCSFSFPGAVMLLRSIQVETIRDAYMVVAGVPNKTTFHAHHICDMALDMLSSIDHLKDPSTGDNIQIRVGEQSFSIYCLNSFALLRLEFATRGHPPRIRCLDPCTADFSRLGFFIHLTNSPPQNDRSKVKKVRDTFSKAPQGVAVLRQKLIILWSVTDNSYWKSSPLGKEIHQHTKWGLINSS